MITIKEFNELISKMRTVKDFDDNAGVEMMQYPIPRAGVIVTFSESGVNIRMDMEVETLRRDETTPYKRGCNG